MSYFESILQVRKLESCPLPLWKLKITDEEYNQLRELLEKRTHIINLPNPFISVCKESVLFFAEYWRREYCTGTHSKPMVYEALQSTRSSVDLCDEFYDAACRGAKMLKIEQYDGKKADPLNSMLYQGGLPMKLVTGDITNSVWDRFTRGLVNKKTNFDELGLGLVAMQSQSLKAYCDQMIAGIETEQFQRMPFYCNNEYDKWYVYLNELGKQERKRQRLLRPFSLDWEFEVDEVKNKICTKYVLKGGQKLPQAFLEEEGLQNKPFFSIQIRVNGKAVDTFDYVNNFCRYAVVSKHFCCAGDGISLVIHEQDKPYINGGLDMSVPHILFRNKEGKYELGNQIGSKKSLLFIPKGWEARGEYSFTSAEFTWGNEAFLGVFIPSYFAGQITVGGTDGCIVFGQNSPLYWTELVSHPIYHPNVTEAFYDAEACKYNLCFDVEDGIRIIPKVEVQYRNKWQNEWGDIPSYGEIFARCIDMNGHFVTPVRFINAGHGLNINFQKADTDSCQIRVVWPHGRVSCDEGTLRANGVWEIKRTDCNDRNKIYFTFIPEGNSRNQFTLSVKAPFKEFSITNTDDEPLASESWVPYTDVDRYMYHIGGHDFIKYVCGDKVRELRWSSDKLYIVENGKKIKVIASEGSLLSLFDSRESLRAMLERTSLNMLNAVIPVVFTTSDSRQLSFEIKDSPFRPQQREDGKIVLTTKDKEVFDFRGALKLLKLDEPNHEPIILRYDEENGYVLPEAIRAWGRTILIGRSRGRVCPILVDLTRELSREYRANAREIAIATINENMGHSKMGDELWQRVIGWFYRAQKEDIPASSLLELSCTSQNYKALLCLAFQLYAQCADEDDRDTLSEQLKSLSKDLAFQWYWLSPYLNEIMRIVHEFGDDDIDNAEIRNIYIKWAVMQGEQSAKYLKALGCEDEYAGNMGICLGDVMSSFTQWMYRLCFSSMTESYMNDANELVVSTAESIIENPTKLYRIDMKTVIYIDSNQDYINEKAAAFFASYNESGTIGNEQWMYQRVNAVAAHIRRDIDLFTQTDQIRRSIIFCIKSCNTAFMVALNNKLIDNNEVR